VLKPDTSGHDLLLKRSCGFPCGLEDTSKNPKQNKRKFSGGFHPAFSRKTISDEV
jgi:hypothetical protein